MKFEVHKRKIAAAARRRHRYDTAETSTERLAAAYDYLRSALKALPEAVADRHRDDVAGQLIQISDQVRQPSQGEPST